jgi:poly(hydroxyalkanoate) depolymerase family esterase
MRMRISKPPCPDAFSDQRLDAKDPALKPFPKNLAGPAKSSDLSRLMELTNDIQKTLSAGEIPFKQQLAGRTTAGGRMANRLKDVVASLHRAKRPIMDMPNPAFPRRAPAPEIPNGAQFIEKSYANHAGTRSYKLYIPAKKSEGMRPLLVMLHGCKQGPDDFAAGTRMNEFAEKQGMLVAYPAQSARANVSACWNWFDPAHQEHGAGEPSLIAGLTEDIIAANHIDPTRVFVAGLSAGGAMAVVMAAAYPNLYAAAGVHSGLPYRSANDVMSAFAAMRGEALPARPQPRVRKIIFHGEADATVHPSNAALIADAPRGLQPETTRHSAADPNGRDCVKTVWRDENGAAQTEKWMIKGAGHAWSGGNVDGSFTDPKGPDASAEMMRFFLMEAAS